MEQPSSTFCACGLSFLSDYCNYINNILKISISSCECHESRSYQFAIFNGLYSLILRTLPDVFQNFVLIIFETSRTFPKISKYSKVSKIFVKIGTIAKTFLLQVTREFRSEYKRIMKKIQKYKIEELLNDSSLLSSNTGIIRNAWLLLLSLEQSSYTDLVRTLVWVYIYSFIIHTIYY